MGGDVNRYHTDTLYHDPWSFLIRLDMTSLSCIVAIDTRPAVEVKSGAP